MHATAYKDASRFAKKYVKPPAKILDIGSLNINGCMRPLFTGCHYTGADLSRGKNVDVVLGKPYEWPELKRDAYDFVVSSQVIEHVPRPWIWIWEVARVLKPGGVVYLCSPNTMPFHEYPVDCWRVWPDGMRALIEETGLKVLECYASGRDTTGIARKPPATSLPPGPSPAVSP